MHAIEQIWLIYEPWRVCKTIDNISWMPVFAMSNLLNEDLQERRYTHTFRFYVILSLFFPWIHQYKIRPFTWNSDFYLINVMNWHEFSLIIIMTIVRIKRNIFYITFIHDQIWEKEIYIFFQKRCGDLRPSANDVKDKKPSIST